MKLAKDPFDRSLSFDRKDVLPVRAPGQKLQDTSKNKFFVKSVSSHPLVQDTSKEELRITYLNNVIQRKINDPKFNHLLGLPKMSNTSNNNIGIAPNQVTINPFSKPPGSIIQGTIPSFSSNSRPLSLPQNLSGLSQTNNPFSQNQIKNPFSSNQNQFQNNNQTKEQRKPFTGMLNPPQLSKQTSFGGSTPSFGNSSSTGLFESGTQPQQTSNLQQTNLPISTPSSLFGNQNNTLFSTKSVVPTNLNPSPTLFGGTSLQQTPGLTTSPSFGNLNQMQIQPPGLFSQTKNQPFQQNLTGQQNIVNPIMNSQITQLQTNMFAPVSTNPPQIINPQNISPQSNPQALSSLDQNIRDLLQSKPNLWNILALDPQYKNGYNKAGRMYVKSVLQRIIDQNILSEQSMNKIMVQIYKKLYGEQNFEKILQSKKKQMSYDQKINQWKLQQLINKSSDQKNSQSIFPKDFNSIPDDFYRSFKRKSAKQFYGDQIIISKKTQDQYENKLQRKYLQIKRPQKNLQLKVKFIQVKKSDQKTNIIQNSYTIQGLQKITQAINEIRTLHRRAIMPAQQQIPDIEGFQISPTLQTIKVYTKFQLQSVPKVIISNEWGSIRFRAPISLLNKKLSECLVINQKSVEIMDEQWKVRQAQITFKKFADFNNLEQAEQNELQDKIIGWCEKEKLQLIKIDRQRGQVTISI